MLASTKLARFLEYLAIFLAAFSSVDLIMDFFRQDLGLATLKCFGMLASSICLYLSIKKPELFNDKSLN